MLAWSEELITDVRKPEIMVMTSFVGGELLFAITPITLTDTSPSPKLKSTRAGRYGFFPVGGMPIAWPERLLSESQDAVALQQIKERGALPMIDHW